MVKFVFSYGKLYYKNCSQKEFNIIGENVLDINIECVFLKTNSFLQRIIKRQFDFKSHTKYSYLTYDQLIEKHDEKNIFLEKKRLENFN